MDRRVGGIAELLEHERVGQLVDQLAGAVDGAEHPVRAGGEHDAGAERTQR